MRKYILFGCIIMTLAALGGCGSNNDYCCTSNDECFTTAEGLHSCSNDKCGKCVLVEPLTITPTTLPDATVEQSDYSFELTVSGGHPPYTWGNLTKGDQLVWLTLVPDENDNSKAWLKNIVSNGQTLFPIEKSEGLPIAITATDNTKRGIDTNREDNKGAVLNTNINIGPCQKDITTLIDCGRCGNKCTNDHGTTACVAGACVPQCYSDFGDCDGNPSNGCESDLTTASCGKAQGEACQQNSECQSLACRCSEETCKTLVCANKDCGQCIYASANGDCTPSNHVNPGVKEPDCNGSSSCYADGCRLDLGSDCSTGSNSSCESGFCDCTNVGCTSRACASVECVCNVYSAAQGCTTTPLSDFVQDPANCYRNQQCVAGKCLSMCTPGATQNQPCGNCGTQTQTCNANNVWGAWSECTGQGCSPGDSGSSAVCGKCGTSTYKCNNSCQWELGSCTGEGICMTGEARPCPNFPSRLMHCINCRWDFSSCG